ncbi:MAG TPA: hypothetical protein VGM07_03400 [Stellaceae bacterium]|jgi:hypothetical protein
MITPIGFFDLFSELVAAGHAFAPAYLGELGNVGMRARLDLMGPAPASRP